MIRRDLPQRQLASTSALARAAFTLMEMLIVVAIIVALAGLGGFYFIGTFSKSKEKMAQAQATEIAKAVETYYVDHQDYPTNLALLLQKGEKGGPYLKRADALQDPWGAEYQFQMVTTESGATVPKVFTVSRDSQLEISNLMGK